MTDYQWPNPALSPNYVFTKNSDSQINLDLYRKIESFFSQLYDLDVILMPSGRASISLLLRYYGLNRSHVVFAPRWSSHCVWDSITRVANPTINCDESCNLIIAVHKWGQIEKLDRIYKCSIIEDSVDSIVTNNRTWFPNNGDFEIVSLPKVIGSYTGGLILCKDSITAKTLRSLLVEDIDFAIYQSELRFRQALSLPMGFARWDDLESLNTSLDFNGLLNIESCLSNLQINKEIILKRLELIESKLHNYQIDRDRLPPVYCVPIDSIDSTDSKLMVRNKNFSGFLDRPDFKKVGLIPLHFRASDDLFNYLFKVVCKN